MLICNKGKKDKGEVCHSGVRVVHRTWHQAISGTWSVSLIFPFTSAPMIKGWILTVSLVAFPVDMTLNFKYSPCHSGNNHVTKMFQGNVLPNLFKL